MFARAPQEHRADPQDQECVVAADRLDAVVSLAKRRGFVFQAGEI
jgi:hypothetical protein